MKALVTGGAGFIGSAVAELLVEDGAEVTVLDDLSTGYRENLSALPDVDLVDGDIRDERLLAEVTQHADAVLHLAASVGNKRSIEHPILDAEINVIGTLRVLEAARSAGVRKVVISSSAGIFGEVRHLPIREDHPVEPVSPYGATKLAAEKLGLAYAGLYDLEVVCLRYFNVYGVRQRYDAYGNAIPIFVRQLLHGEPLTVFGDGEQTRDFVNVRDVARANLLAARADGFSGALNVASGTATTVNTLIGLLADASGVTPQVRRAPPRPGDVRDSVADISAAREALGYAPCVELPTGLSEYVAWAREAFA